MRRATCWTAVSLLVFAGAARGQGHPPAEAAGKMTVTDGLAVRLFASEPEVRQPILVKVDDRGRLWTIQYLQYPNPAGLKRVKVDRWSRTVYDRVPEPPPRGPRGADRITILEDRDGDGRADHFKDFVKDLNLATGVAFGHGGVFVMQVPYLLFYADRNRDDVPDGPPEVLLKGFGMEDAQSLANHLTWGPDGWLYGVNGSTTTCRIRGVEFQQGVWRYHPLTRDFELFCEGGGNTFGVTFDGDGNLFYSTNGGPFVHALQGAYYRKSFGKHGPLHNLYAYGFFEVVARDQVPGGPPTGGTIYQAAAFPPRYHGAFIAGNFLGNSASAWTLRPQATTFTAKYAGQLLRANDRWFGPTDMCLAPDGGMFISDFHDARTSHPDPDARWDRSNGRIFKIAPVKARKSGAGEANHEGEQESNPDVKSSLFNLNDFDLAKLSGDALVDLLADPNRWFADRARVELAARRDRRLIPRLLSTVRQTRDGRQALQGLWALHACGGLDESTAAELLNHPYPYVRSWTVRLMGDRKRVSTEMRKQLVQLAAGDRSPIVRCQLAATAKRLPGEDGLPIVKAILRRDLDDADPRIPLMLWWALESKASSDRSLLLAMFAHANAWTSASYRGNIRRLARRWAAEGTAASYLSCDLLADGAPAEHAESLLRAIAQGLRERSEASASIGQGGLFEAFAQPGGGAVKAKRGYARVAEPLQRRIVRAWRERPLAPWRLEMALRAEAPEAYQTLLAALRNDETPAARQVELLRLLAEFGRDDSLELLVAKLAAQSPAVQSAALTALFRFSDARVVREAIAVYPRLAPQSKVIARGLLLGRRDGARQLLQMVDRGALPAKEIAVEELPRVSLHNDKGLDRLVQKHWGRITAGTPEQRLATMRRYNNDLRAASGDAAKGKLLFAKHCAVCHQLFGEGNKAGPDLTSTSRKDRAALLANLVDPSAVVRREYLSYVVRTNGGQVLTGLIAEQDASSITLLDAKNRRTRIRRNEIDSLRESPVSLMPDNLLESLTPQQRRDLFAYLQR